MKLILVFYLLIFFNLGNCQTPYQEANAFTDYLKINPKSIIEIVESKKIKVHDALIKDIDNGNYPLKLIAWEITRFYKRNKNINVSFSENNKDFYSNSWRDQFVINEYKYYSIIYSSQNYPDTLKYEFLINKNNDLILFEIQSNLMKNITDVLINNPEAINILDSSKDFILNDSLKNKIKIGKINLGSIADTVKAFNFVDEKLSFRVLSKKNYFKTNNYRRSINIDNFEYNNILYSKKKYNKAIEFEFLIDTENDIMYLFHLSYGIFILPTYDK